MSASQTETYFLSLGSKYILPEVIEALNIDLFDSNDSSQFEKNIEFRWNLDDGILQRSKKAHLINNFIARIRKLTVSVYTIL